MSIENQDHREVVSPSEVLSAPVSLGAGMTSEEILREFAEWINVSQQYLRSNKRGFDLRSTVLRFVTLLISAAATIILGLQNLSFWPRLAFALVSLLTAISSIEPFFAWRARWVLMEEAQYKLHRLKDDIAFILASHPANEVPRAEVERIYRRYQDAWDQLSLQWLEHRKHDKSSG